MRMKMWRIPFLRFHRDERGATAIEYGIVAGLCSIMIAGATAQIGGIVSAFFESILVGFK